MRMLRRINFVPSGLIIEPSQRAYQAWGEYIRLQAQAILPLNPWGWGPEPVALPCMTPSQQWGTLGETCFSPLVGDIPGRFGLVLGLISHPDVARVGARVSVYGGRGAHRTAEVVEGVVAPGGVFMETRRGWRGACQHLLQFARAYRSLTTYFSTKVAVERGLTARLRGGVRALGVHPTAPHRWTVATDLTQVPFVQYPRERVPTQARGQVFPFETQELLKSGLEKAHQVLRGQPYWEVPYLGFGTTTLGCARVAQSARWLFSPMQPDLAQTPRPQPLATDVQAAQEIQMGGEQVIPGGLIVAAEGELLCGGTLCYLPSNLGLEEQRRTVPLRHGLGQTVWAHVGAVEVHLCGLLIRPRLQDSAAAVELVPYLRYGRVAGRKASLAARK
jgi:hypothetical protein